MELIHTTIGEHYIQIACHSNTFLSWIRLNFQAAAPSKTAPDLYITLTEGYGIPFVDYNVEISKGSNAIAYRRADYLIESDFDYRNAKVNAYDELALKHALMNLYSAFLVRHQWGLLIHSSCVVDNGKAHLFAGHSGVGKSTVAKFSLPRELLSDEATLLKITPQEVTVFNSPFRSELHVTNAEASSPLASIQLLKQAQTIQRSGLTKASGLLQLMDKVFYWAHEAEETRKILGLLSMLTNTVPIYELQFQKNDRFWELIS